MDKFLDKQLRRNSRRIRGQKALVSSYKYRKLHEKSGELAYLGKYSLPVQGEAMQGVVVSYDETTRMELATKGDIQDVRNELKQDIQNLRNELKQDMIIPPKTMPLKS